MSVTIRNSGTEAYGATVDSSGRLNTYATTHTEAHVATYSGGCYIANIADAGDTLTITATGGYILYLAADATSDGLYVDRISIYGSANGQTATIERNPTLGSISNHETHVPRNMNTGSTKTADVTCYSWDEASDGMGGLTDNAIYEAMILSIGDNEPRMQEAIFVAPGTAIGITMHGAGEGAASIQFHME